MDSCLFCEILQGSTPATFVYRNDEVAAFMDIQPVNPGHILVVPVAHATDLAELAPSGAAALMITAQRIAGALRASDLRCEGIDLLLADGEAAGQEVFHTHLHVIPRSNGDGFGFRFGPNYSQLPSRADLEAAASSVRSGLEPVAEALTAEIIELDHVQLAMPSGQEDVARTFYIGVLGLREESKPATLAGRGGVWFAAGSARIHLGVEEDFRPARKAHPALIVNGLTTLAARCREAGYVPVSDDALPGYDRFYVADPFGNRLELLQLNGQR